MAIIHTVVACCIKNKEDYSQMARIRESQQLCYFNKRCVEDPRKCLALRALQ